MSDVTAAIIDRLRTLEGRLAALERRETTPPASSGLLVVGTNDSTAGTFRAYGNGTGSNEGGEVRLYTAADHDGTYDYWFVDAYRDNLRFGVGASVLSTMTPDGGIQMTGDLRLGPFTELTIASGAITVTGSLHTVDTEGDAASDDLTTINGGATGSLLVLRSAATARVVVLKDGGGNLLLAGDCTLNTYHDTITLIKLGSSWYELARSNNA